MRSKMRIKGRKDKELKYENGRMVNAEKIQTYSSLHRMNGFSLPK